MKKYAFTGQTMQFEGHTLRRIRYLRDVGVMIRKGDTGGWLEGEHNLSHDGDSYVAHEGKVFGNARIEGKSVIGNHAVVKDNAQIKGNSTVYADSVVGADTIIVDSEISGHSMIFFYKDSNEELKHNLFKSKISGNSIIEATGKIEYCNFRNVELEGYLYLKHEYKR